MTCREIFIIAHLLGLCLALPAALGADFQVIRSVFAERTPPFDLEWLEPRVYRIRLGFVLLGLSGLGVIAFDHLENPQMLGNAKLWAKLTVVALTALNGYWIENALRSNLQTVSSRTRQLLMLCTASFSCVSWATALILGSARSSSFQASFKFLILIYGAISLLVVAAMSIAWLIFSLRNRNLTKISGTLQRHSPNSASILFK